MKLVKRLITLDANVLVAALKRDEPYHRKCVNVLKKIPTSLFLRTKYSLSRGLRNLG